MLPMLSVCHKLASMQEHSVFCIRHVHLKAQVVGQAFVLVYAAIYLLKS